MLGQIGRSVKPFLFVRDKPNGRDALRVQSCMLLNGVLLLRLSLAPRGGK